MQPLKKFLNIEPKDISNLIKSHYSILMQSFYESQSTFLCASYKKYKSIESANIILCFQRNIHLEIIRQREKDLNYNVSLENFWDNYNNINKPIEKIVSISKITDLPKETVRRKINKLKDLGFLINQEKGFSLNISQKDKEMFSKHSESETKNLSTFVAKILNNLNIKIKSEVVEREIKSQFSFYWYHYLSCQIEWLKWWQAELKDNDLLLIALQATIPTLHYMDKNMKILNLDEVFLITGKVERDVKNKNFDISATSVSDVTGIPRPTSIRKLDKLVNLGFLTRDDKTKRYSVNQSTDARTKNILSRSNVNFTIKTFSEYIAIISNSLIRNKL